MHNRMTCLALFSAVLPAAGCNNEPRDDDANPTGNDSTGEDPGDDDTNNQVDESNPMISPLVDEYVVHVSVPPKIRTMPAWAAVRAA